MEDKCSAYAFSTCLKKSCLLLIYVYIHTRRSCIMAKNCCAKCHYCRGMCAVFFSRIFIILMGTKSPSPKYIWVFNFILLFHYRLIFSWFLYAIFLCIITITFFYLNNNSLYSLIFLYFCVYKKIEVCKRFISYYSFSIVCFWSYMMYWNVLTCDIIFINQSFLSWVRYYYTKYWVTLYLVSELQNIHFS